jgi:hypothetical protein
MTTVITTSARRSAQSSGIDPFARKKVKIPRPRATKYIPATSAMLAARE